MTDFAQHLASLTTSSGTGSDLELKTLGEWTSPSAYGHDVDGLLQVAEDDPVDEPWSTVLDLFSRDTESPAVKTVCQNILSKPGSHHTLHVLVEVLSSSRTDEEISGKVVELVGLDQVELVEDLLKSRRSAAKDLSRYLNSRYEQQANASANSQPSIGIPVSLAPEDVRRRVEETLEANAARPLWTGTAQEAPEVLPHVYTSWANMGGGSILSQYGSKYMLPIGTTRHDYEDYEEVVIPPAKAVPPRESERLIPVSELDELARGSFPGYTSLNRIQSIVYPTAYGSNENMLVCAPTGAGKTDVAMLTILRVLDQHRSIIAPGAPLRTSINRDSFKIIYVAPMKALASEIVQKFSRRLKWLSILVRELTGDMQLTKAEIAETQIIVTTPEKWDVVTRKPTGEGELASRLKLLIIDEVHLLNEARGAVIETIVARTLRQVESSQSVIRIVGLSATLPNYIDVAEFLSVSLHTGLFYFDSSFRPVPLEQHFIGIRGKPGSSQSKRNLDRVTFEKVSELVHQDHQVMVFVHARKETVNAARALKDAATADGTLDDYSCQDHPRWDIFRRNIGESHNKEMKELFDLGFGIHHAGMLRSDRNLMERMFQERVIKVLCCTATLAWGVNLPAHAVVIKGTQVYDSGKGSFVDLSVLDVLQVFGRAGRPGLETSGEGYICTTNDKLTHYLNAVASQNPIESQFRLGMVDALNAEIALGTVSSVAEGVRWLGYTYLFVRMRKNPTQYGIPRETLEEDSYLLQQRAELIKLAASRLANLTMIDFDVDGNTFTIRDVGRIAAKYYIRHQSIEVFRPQFRAQMTEADILGMLSKSTEFDQIQIRESEIKELKHLMKIIPCEVRGGTDTSQGKVNVLLQSFISNLPVQDSALVSDTAYVAQNGNRIVRALLEIAMSRKWAGATTTLMGMSKAVEKRMWPYEEPLRQFNLKAEILHGLDQSRTEYHPAELATWTAAELGNLIRLNEYQGRGLLAAAKQFPSLEVEYSLRPLGPDTLKVTITVIRAFDWSLKVHGTVEPFWLWVEDHEGKTILQLAQILLRESTDSLDVEFVISISADTLPPSITIRLVSDKWLGADNELPVQLDGISMPAACHSHARRLDAGFLPLSTIRLPAPYNHLPHLREFNAIQTQVFWSITNTKLNILFAAPSGCGKSFLAHMVVWTALLKSRLSSWVLIIVPNGNAATKIISEMRHESGVMGVGLENSTGTNLFTPPNGKVIRVVTATSLLESFSLTGPTPIRSFPEVILYEDLDQMDAFYELAIALTRHAAARFPSRSIGLARSLIDPTDLASWLGVESMGLHSFLPRDREQPLTCSIQPYTISYSGALFKALAKPVYTAIRGIHTGGAGIIFVPSRGHCQSVAQDLITQCALASVSERGFLPESFSSIYVEDYLARIRDATLVNFVSRGVAVFHPGISKSDRNLVLELFAEGIVKLVIAPLETCWSLPVRVEVVVVMGTQYIQGDASKSERRLRDYTIGEVVQMQSRAVRQNGSGHFVLFCPAEAVEMFNKFLNQDGLPLESQLLETGVLERWYQERREDGTIRNKQDGVDVLSFTFLARRMMKNPTYYGLHPGTSEAEALSRIVDGLERK
ncbi:Sec63-domain-containing protein [Boletus reticuloceps]|uniref:Sec63-domain-containing protein n=1 Tax=Boletus reticuloceps TaxID=495285 RepID=A0A8I2YYJ5_9AGAM|nr:Sec63-domain-containing protein [Boletus reticuloceps]